MKAVVDQDTCTGCELCPATCPEVFEMNSDGKAEARGDGTIPPGVEDSAKEAAENCPVEAITVA